MTFVGFASAHIKNNRLEFSYEDIIFDTQTHFVVDESVSRTNKYDDILDFLRKRYRLLRIKFLNERVVFGYKGKEARRVLRDASITDLLDIEVVGVPSERWLSYLYPDLMAVCQRRKGQCAVRTLRLAKRFLKDNEEFVRRKLKKKGIRMIQYVDPF